MTTSCPRCGAACRSGARFCSACGLALAATIGHTPTPGQFRHPQPAAAPDGFAPVANAADLHYRWSQSWGGDALLDTEPRVLAVFNAGYSLSAVRVGVVGRDARGRNVFTIEKEIESLPRGATVEVEVASWELAPAEQVTVSLADARFMTENDAGN